ncbi:hypothetical protein M2152_001301 [Microbacteriaceae bacterium SG_E_30_P1]|uniref:Uncharacterized protein n=1 Tax=Antiquaquibacter oligotrophicus TaxID=2880260 RepID=A0ABT6KPL4_9MICO|nr:hypothetical protein [Antiquaquibacter oligotrophicus]MDH6181119.1 hypothetical protein [Antiquaquibacter oligotrophicus]UDF13184.1 hypothetical protein LH407_13635 [Antiquaquibacter oligotrophicus]
MAIDQHPNVFSFEGRRWVSEAPAADARASLVAQREWDAKYLRSQHWALALALGAAGGSALTLGLGSWSGLPPVFYLVLLPLGFGFGAVLGAAANKRLLGSRLTEEPPTPRPEVPKIVRIPASVARRVDDTTPVSDLIVWSEKGIVPQNDRGTSD